MYVRIVALNKVPFEKISARRLFMSVLLFCLARGNDLLGGLMNTLAGQELPPAKCRNEIGLSAAHF